MNTLLRPQETSTGQPVLIVASDAATRSGLEVELSALGYRATTVGDADQAFRLLAQDETLVVVAELGVAGDDGEPLAAAMKRKFPKSELVLVSEEASTSVARTAVLLGACDLLVRPLDDPNELASSISRAAQRVARHRHELALLEAASRERQALMTLIGQLPIGVLVVSTRGSVLLSNRVANGMLETGDALYLTAAGKLRARCDVAAAALRRLLHSPSGDNGHSSTGFQGALPIPRVDGGAPLHAAVGELTWHGDGKCVDEPSVVILVSDPERRSVELGPVLSQLYSLTPAEADLAALLVQGRALEDAANELSITRNTARTHMKRIFSKTSTHRQGELISLVLSGPAVLRFGALG
jgi:DNA-binding NarL/FixJ family response regulator